MGNFYPPNPSEAFLQEIKYLSLFLKKLFWIPNEEWSIGGQVGIKITDQKILW